MEGALDPPPDTIPGQPDPPPGPGTVNDAGPSIDDDDDQPNFGTVAAPASLVDSIAEDLGEEWRR